MASTIFSLTEENIQKDPWSALKVVINNNPTALAVALSDNTGLDFTGNPQEIYNWAVQYYKENGHIDPLIEAAENVEIIGNAPSAKSSGGGKGGINWGTVLGGVTQAVAGFFGGGSASQGPTQEQLLAQQQAAAERRAKTTRTVLIVLGVVIAAVAVVLIIKKGKK